MQKRNKLLTLYLAVALAGLPAPAGAKKKDKASAAAGEITGDQPAVLWREPTNISAEDLFYGPGGKQHEPRGPFTFSAKTWMGPTQSLSWKMAMA